ncbi:MAG: rhomboid family intramembrane serine protease [Clostridiaceae bacterium]|nr:rhomboid family intramembrane serine protease [Clostridiaceae bacterium]
MKAYIKNLVQNLYEHYGYSILELGEINGLCTNWGVYKKTDSSIDVMFFCNLEGSYQLNIHEIETLARKHLQTDNIRLIQSIIDDRLKIESNENGELRVNQEIYQQCGLILINNVDNKVLYFSEGLKDKAQELATIINYTSTSQNRTTKAERPIITYVLISVNVLAYILTAYLSGNIVDSNINVLIFLGAKVNQLINQGEYYRFITCMFLHGGIIHLALNMYALNSLGPLVEKIYGRPKYVFIYFLAGIISSIFSYIFSTSVSIGASGAIFGLLGAALVFAVKMKNSVGKGFMMNIVSVIAINLVIGLSIPNVDNFGHMGGLIGGVITSLLLFRR